MQFIIAKTPNLKEYFYRLSPFKKGVFALTILFFVAAGSFLALGVYALARPQSQPNSGEITSPVGFFGRLSKNKPQGYPEDTSAKTIPSPLNGVLYTPTEAADWQSRRPMAITVNNHLLARPQTGLSQADLVYEAVAEGGITRLLAVFHSQIPEKVGSVRSARVHFSDFAKENDAWLSHWGGWKNGGEADVYSHMRQIFVSSIDAMDAVHDISKGFYRDYSRDVPYEHTGFAIPQKLYELAYQIYPDQPKALREVTSSWVFKDDVGEAERPDNQRVEFNFWDVPDFKVIWDYDKATNAYKRTQGGQPFTDGATGNTLLAKDVVVLFMDERALNDGHGHLIYKTVGQGTGKAFLDGGSLDINWVRKSLSERTRFLTGEKGHQQDLALNRGQIWIEILPTGSALVVHDQFNAQ